jgi:hypothetical protein
MYKDNTKESIKFYTSAAKEFFFTANYYLNQHGYTIENKDVLYKLRDGIKKKLDQANSNSLTHHKALMYRAKTAREKGLTDLAANVENFAERSYKKWLEFNFQTCVDEVKEIGYIYLNSK